MKKIVRASVIFIFCTPYLQAARMSIMNMMSQQALVSIDTEQKSYSMQVNPSENLNLQENLDHANKQYDNPLPYIDFDQSPIKKISIKRMQSDIPQIIYYNDEVTTDKGTKPLGIYNINLSHIGSMKIVQDGITLNNQNYSIHDISSFKTKSQKLKDMLISKKDIHKVEHEINDLAESLRLFEGSDMAPSLSLQLAVIRSEVDYLVNKLQIIHQIKDYVSSLQDITKTVTADNVDAVESKLNNMIAGLQTLDQSNFSDSIDLEKIKKDVTILQSKISDVRKKIEMMNRPMLINN